MSCWCFKIEKSLLSLVLLTFWPGCVISQGNCRWGSWPGHGRALHMAAHWWRPAHQPPATQPCMPCCVCAPAYRQNKLKAEILKIIENLNFWLVVWRNVVSIIFKKTTELCCCLGLVCDNDWQRQRPDSALTARSCCRHMPHITARVELSYTL